jgi:hypothetical protein
VAPNIPKRLQGSNGRVIPFKVTARDAEDLAVVAAFLQDAILPAPEMTYDPETKRFVAILSRFRWERVDRGPTGEDGAPLYERVHTALRFEEVTSVRSIKLDRGDPKLMLNLLSIGWETVDGGDVVDLVFADGATIRLDVARLSCHVEDLGEPWVTPFRPDHDTAPDADGTSQV